MMKPKVFGRLNFVLDWPHTRGNLTYIGGCPQGKTCNFSHITATKMADWRSGKQNISFLLLVVYLMTLYEACRGGPEIRSQHSDWSGDWTIWGSSSVGGKIFVSSP